MTPAQVLDELTRMSRLLDDALSYARRAAEEYSVADDDYRCQHALAFVSAKDAGKTDAAAKALADLATKGVRQRARLAEQMAQVSLEAIRARRAQLSALQTGGAALRAELELARYGPEVSP